MSDVVIFGSGPQAEVAHFYLTSDSPHDVKAFAVDREYLNETTFFGLPVVPFDEVEQHYPPSSTKMLIAIGYSGMNSLRREKYDAAKAKGYELITYVNSGTSLRTKPKIGDNCFILEDNTIQPFVTIGNNVTLWSGNHIGHHSVIKDHTFIASHVVVSGGVEIGEQCFVGVNATLRDHIKVGDRCVIGAGALLLADADPEGVYIGAATERSKVPSARLRRI